MLLSIAHLMWLSCCLRLGKAKSEGPISQKHLQEEQVCWDEHPCFEWSEDHVQSQAGKSLLGSQIWGIFNPVATFQWEGITIKRIISFFLHCHSPATYLTPVLSSACVCALTQGITLVKWLLQNIQPLLFCIATTTKRHKPVLWAAILCYDHQQIHFQRSLLPSDIHGPPRQGTCSAVGQTQCFAWLLSKPKAKRWTMLLKGIFPGKKNHFKIQD